MMRNSLLVLTLVLVVVQAQEPKPMQEVTHAIRDWSVRDLLGLKRQVERMLIDRMLTPAPEVRKAFASHPTIKVARIVQRGLLSGVKEPRGGGAFFSFVTASHSYNLKPDIELQHNRFYSGFTGDNVGMIVSIDVEGIAEVTMKDVPPALAGDAAEFYSSVRNTKKHPRATKGAVYIVRSVRWGETDVIAAMEVLRTDEYGVTFAWRLLRADKIGRRPQ